MPFGGSTGFSVSLTPVVSVSHEVQGWVLPPQEATVREITVIAKNMYFFIWVLFLDLFCFLCYAYLKEGVRSAFTNLPSTKNPANMIFLSGNWLMIAETVDCPQPSTE